MDINIIPLKKVLIDGKEIAFDMKKEQVIRVLGIGKISNIHYYFNNELAIDYDANNCVEYIEFLGGYEGELQPMIYGNKAFQINADDLYEILRKNNAGEISDCENGYSYRFLVINVGVYRTSTPESVQRDIDEMTAEGAYDPDYVEDEMKKASHWELLALEKDIIGDKK